MRRKYRKRSRPTGPSRPCACRRAWFTSGRMRPKPAGCPSTSASSAISSSMIGFSPSARARNSSSLTGTCSGRYASAALNSRHAVRMSSSQRRRSSGRILTPRSRRPAISMARRRRGAASSRNAWFPGGRHEEPGEHVVVLPHARRFQQARVVRRGVGLHDRGQAVESLDEDAGLVVGRGVEGAAHRRQAAGCQPRRGGVDEQGGSLGVVPALEEPEGPQRLVQDFVRPAVVDRGDGAGHRAAAERHPQPALGGAPEGVAARIHLRDPVGEDRLDPVGVAPVDGAGEPEEARDLAPGLGRHDPQRQRTGRHLRQPATCRRNGIITSRARSFNPPSGMMRSA